MPTLLEIEDLRSELFAEDIPIHDAMLRWTFKEASAYFESGGQVIPATSTASPQQNTQGARAALEARDRELAMRLQAEEHRAPALPSPPPMPAWAAAPAPTHGAAFRPAANVMAADLPQWARMPSAMPARNPPAPPTSVPNLTPEQRDAQEAAELDRAIALSLKAEEKAEKARQAAELRRYEKEKREAEERRKEEEGVRKLAEMAALAERSAVNERARAAKEAEAKVAAAKVAAAKEAEANALAIETGASVEPAAWASADRLAAALSHSSAAVDAATMTGLAVGEWANCELLQALLEVLAPAEAELEARDVLLVDIPTAQLIKLADAEQQCEAIIDGPQCADMRHRMAKCKLMLALLNDNEDPEDAAGGKHWSVVAFRREREPACPPSPAAQTRPAPHAHTLHAAHTSRLTPHAPHARPHRAVCATRSGASSHSAPPTARWPHTYTRAQMRAHARTHTCARAHTHVAGWTDGIFVLEHYDPSGNAELNCDAAQQFATALAERLSEICRTDADRIEVWRMPTPRQHNGDVCGLTSLTFLKGLIDDFFESASAPPSPATPRKGAAGISAPPAVAHTTWREVEALRQAAARRWSPTAVEAAEAYAAELSAREPRAPPGLCTLTQHVVFDIYDDADDDEAFDELHTDDAADRFGAHPGGGGKVGHSTGIDGPLYDFLQAVGLAPLGTVLGRTGLTLEACVTKCLSDRTPFLSRLRESGVSKVTDRQAFANAIGKASREGWLRPPYKGPYTHIGREMRSAREVCVPHRAISAAAPPSPPSPGLTRCDPDATSGGAERGCAEDEAGRVRRVSARGLLLEDQMIDEPLAERKMDPRRVSPRSDESQDGSHRPSSSASSVLDHRYVLKGHLYFCAPAVHGILGNSVRTATGTS